MPRALTIGLHATIVAVTGEEPRVLTVGKETGAGGVAALPFGPLDAERHRTLELGLRAWVRDKTGMELPYVEQLYTFGDRDRALASDRPSRVIAVAYLALVRERQVVAGHAASWQGVYRCLPWEDRRAGAPEILTRIRPALSEWIAAADDESARRDRRGRVDITFGSGAARWDNERVLERYELLYEAGLVPESARDRDAAARRGAVERSTLAFGAPLALDHRRILATALGRLRGKLKYRPLVFEIMPDTFTLLQLQRTVESLVGARLHKQNFRRLVERGALVEGTGRTHPDTGGRPAEFIPLSPRSAARTPGPRRRAPAAAGGQLTSDCSRSRGLGARGGNRATQRAPGSPWRNTAPPNGLWSRGVAGVVTPENRLH